MLESLTIMPKFFRAHVINGRFLHELGSSRMFQAHEPDLRMLEATLALAHVLQNFGEKAWASTDYVKHKHLSSHM